MVHTGRTIVCPTHYRPQIIIACRRQSNGHHLIKLVNLLRWCVESMATLNKINSDSQ